MNDIAVTLEHVDLLNLLNGLNVQFLEVRLQLLVVGSSSLVDLLDLASRSSLASIVKVCVSLFALSFSGYPSLIFVEARKETILLL